MILTAFFRDFCHTFSAHLTIEKLGQSFLFSFNSIDVNSLKDKLGTANSQISQLTSKLPVIDQSLIGSVTAKFGSSSLGNSPLDKLVNGKFNLG